jgi:hypothetical protein
MNDPSMGSVVERLEQLERQYRQWRWTDAATALILLGAVITLIYLRPEHRGEIRTERLLIVDHEGRTLVRLAANAGDQESGLMEFLDRAATPTFSMGLGGRDHAFLRLVGGGGDHDLRLEVGNNLGARIAVGNHGRDRALLLGASPSGVVALGVMSPHDNVALQCGVQPDGAAHFEMRDANGKVLVRLPNP